MISPDRLSPEAKRILQPYFGGLDLDRIRVYDKIPWYIIDRPAGYTDRYRIYIDPQSVSEDPLEQFALLVHEIEHSRQYLENGTWRFRYLYLLSYLKNRFRGLNHRQAYRNIEFEVQARMIESRVVNDLLAQACALPQPIEKQGRETFHV